VIAVDASILVHAHRGDSPLHAAAAEKLIAIASAGEPWAIPWPSVHEYLGVVTSRRVFTPPTHAEMALAFVQALMESPGLALIGESNLHWQELSALIVTGKVAGARVNDARIAAICIEHGVSELWSADRDYGRFPQLKVVNPLVGR
jgi:hypothetical protein